MRKPSQSAVRAWTRLNRAQRLVFDAIEAELKAAGFPPLDVYDALLELSRAPDRRMRQLDLRSAMLFRQYSMSRLVDRLEQDGLVRRERCADDARAQWIVITEKGLALRAAMWPPYADAIARVVGDKLSDHEADRIAKALEKLYG